MTAEEYHEWSKRVKQLRLSPEQCLQQLQKIALVANSQPVFRHIPPNEEPGTKNQEPA